MITGSIASIMYGEPRLTHDIDIVITITSDEIVKLMNAFPSEKYYCPPEEVLQIESRRAQRGHFNIIHHESGLKADFYFLGAEAYQRDAMKRRVKKELLNEKFWLAPLNMLFFGNSSTIAKDILRSIYGIFVRCSKCRTRRSIMKFFESISNNSHSHVNGRFALNLQY